MQLNRLTRQITLLLSTVVGLAVISSVLTLYGSWFVRQLLDDAVDRYLPGVLAAEELQLALLEQRGLLSSYMLDNGDDVWLDRLSDRRGDFQNKYATALATVRTAEGSHILSRLNLIYAEYDEQRNRAIQLYQQGDATAAARMVTADLYNTYDRAHELCRTLVDVRIGALSMAADDARRRVWFTTAFVAMVLIASVLIWIALLMLLVRRVWRPLRKLAADASRYGNRGITRFDGPTDEMRLVGLYLQSLVSDVAEARHDLQRSRTQLLGAEKLATVGKLAASVAHEIRNPLTAMKMWLFSITRSLAERPDLQNKLDLISGEIDRLESIVRNFLEFSRPANPHRRRVEVQAIVQRTVDLVRGHASEQSVRITADIAPSLPAIDADPDQIKQVMINLIDNALAVLGPDGEIRITAGESQLSSGRAAVELKVCDTGPGIPEDVQARIFEPFFTTKEDGTGLGLCIAAQIIAAHDGQLRLASSSSAGTCFALVFEAAPPQSA